MKFNFASAIQAKLTSEEWYLVSYYVNKAQDLYDADRDSAARDALDDAIAICLSNGEHSAANKIEYYKRFC